MAFKHGKGGEVWFNGADVSPYMTTADFSVKADMADVTTFKSSSRSFIPGPIMGVLTTSGYYDPAALTTSLEATLGGATSPIVTYSPAGAVAIGDVAYPLLANATDYKEGSKVGSSITFDWSLQTVSGFQEGVCLLPLSVQGVGTNTQVGDGVRTSVSSATGAIATAHVTAYTSGSQTVKFQDSTTLGGAYADITGGAFPAITATGGYRLVIPGTIRAFVKCVTIIAGAQITVGVAFART